MDPYLAPQSIYQPLLNEVDNDSGVHRPEYTLSLSIGAHDEHMTGTLRRWVRAHDADSPAQTMDSGPSASAVRSLVASPTFDAGGSPDDDVGIPTPTAPVGTTTTPLGEVLTYA